MHKEASLNSALGLRPCLALPTCMQACPTEQILGSLLLPTASPGLDACSHF